MSIDSAIRRFRSRQAGQFTATADLFRALGAPVYEDGESVYPVEQLYTDRPCKVTSNERSGSNVNVAETQVRQVDQDIKFAVDTDVRIDDIVVITSSEYNALSVGKQYRITDVDDREWQISRRCIIEETIAPMRVVEEGS